MKQALLWEPVKGDKVACRLCSHFCLIEEGQRGLCGVRENRKGALFALSYGKIAAVNLDPVEKKPLYHFLPGSTTFSLATPGCNFSCRFCQNYSLSQPPRPGGPIEGRVMSPEQLVAAAKDCGSRSISYTYSEPTVFFELVLETSRLACGQGLRNILVSNGFQSPQCLSELGPHIQAANIDLKAFSEDFYREQCGAKLKPVLDNLKRMIGLGWWVEVTTLVIPGLNDSKAELGDIAGFIARELGAHVPWHVSRFHPTYKLTDRPPTPVSTLERALAAGKDAGLQFVYIGNVPGHDADDTRCPSCLKRLIARSGFAVTENLLAEGACPQCGEKIAGVWT